MKARLRIVKPRLWGGNGFGYDPAHYEVAGHPGIRVECYSSPKGWAVLVDGERTDWWGRSFAEARELALSIAIAKATE
jgi:hypothetical protein